MQVPSGLSPSFLNNKPHPTLITTTTHFPISIAAPPFLLHTIPVALPILHYCCATLSLYPIIMTTWLSKQKKGDLQALADRAGVSYVFAPFVSLLHDKFALLFNQNANLSLAC
jgi:hypothetical protein